MQSIAHALFSKCISKFQESAQEIVKVLDVGE